VAAYVTPSAVDRACRLQLRAYKRGDGFLPCVAVEDNCEIFVSC
jgi:hypothetical protein